MQNLKANWLMAWKMTWSISSIFMRAVESLKIYTLIRSFCKKHIKFTPKSTEDLSLMTLKSDAKFEEKLALGSKNDMMNLANFNASNGKSENLHSNVLLFSYKFSAKKVQKSYLSWHWRVLQTLKKKSLFV